MAKTFLGLINELNAVGYDSFDEKLALTKLAAEKLVQRKEYASNLLYPLLERLMMDLLDTKIEKDFYEVYIVPYFDTDKDYRISIRMTFLQRFDNYSPDMDENIANAIDKELKKKNLELLVNDICINTSQYRNGSKQ